MQEKIVLSQDLHKGDTASLPTIVAIDADDNTPLPMMSDIADVAEFDDTDLLTTDDITQTYVNETGKVGQFYDEFEESVPEWLFDGWLELGTVAMLTGDSNVGKSMLTAKLAYHVTNGIPWPNGSACPIGGVVFVSPEDNKRSSIKPRLRWADVDQSKVLNLNTVLDKEASTRGNMRERYVTFPTDFKLLQRAIKQAEALLVIIDPISAVFENSTHNEYLRHNILPQLAGIAEKEGCCIVLINHTGKGEYAKRNTASKTQGGIAIQQLVRSAAMVQVDESQPDIITVKQVKASHGPIQDALAYRIVTIDKGKASMRIFAQWVDDRDNLPELLEALNSKGESIVKQRIKALLFKEDRALHSSVIAQKLNITPDTIRPTISRLVADGTLEKTAYGTYQLTANFKQACLKNLAKAPTA